MERSPATVPGRLAPVLAVVLALAVAWATYAACTEVGRAFASLDARTERMAGVMGWREGAPAVVRFRRFVDAARPLLPAESRVVFTSPENSPGQQFFRSRWAAYLLPEVEIMTLADPVAPQVGQYLLSYGVELDHPRLELTRRLPGGWLYRIRP